MNSKLENTEIERLIRDLSNDSPQAIRRAGMLFGDDSDSFTEKTSRANRWAYKVDDLLMLAGESTVDQWHRHEDELDYAVKDVYAHEEIHGTVRHNKQTLKLYIGFKDLDLGSPSRSGCSLCRHSPSEICYHVLGFLGFVADELDRRGAKLRTQIDKGRFKKGKPNYADFQPDPTSQAFAEIREMARILPTCEADGEASLPPIDASIEQRLCWAFQHTDQQITVDVLLQQRKKRGTGFTKGRKLNLQRLLQDRKLPASDADLKVIEQIELVDDYYYRDKVYRLPELAALETLVGQPNVTLNGDPCTIEPQTVQMTMVELPDGKSMRFQLLRPWDIEGSVPCLLDELRLAYVDIESNRIGVCHVGETAMQVIRSFLQMSPFAKDQAAKVAKEIKPFQSVVSIRLPESIGGPISLEATDPVVILRSRSDGKLDYGIRVRTKAGSLKTPGEGVILRLDTSTKKPVQRLRDPQSEIASAARLLDELGLTTTTPSASQQWTSVSQQWTSNPPQWNGTIDDFQVGLRVIERLQSDKTDAEVLWDKTSEKPIKVLGSLASRNVRVDIASKRNWFGITGQCTFDNQSIPLHELLSGLPSGDQSVGDFVRLGNDGWARINDRLQQQLRQLRDATNTDRKTLKLDATAAPAIRDMMAEDVEIKATKAWQKCLERFANAETLQPTVPKNLDAQLRDYQVDGYKWLSRLAAWGVGGILADDMGLGKTLQTLAVLLDRSPDGPALVIAPTSVGFNWHRETQRFAPDLDVHLYRETDRADFLSSVGPGTVVICSYGLALRDAKALADVDWNTLVLDEAQAIKNSRSKTSRAIATIDADWTVALTGTPVENHLGELWSLFHVVSPGVFGGWEQFRNRYAGPIEKQDDEDARQSLATRIQPFVLRRTKSQVLTELPPRTEMNLYVDLSPAERAEYEKVRRVAIGEIEEIESLPSPKDQRFKILALMTRLRQISCHAGLVNKDWSESSAKLDQLCETLQSLREEGHRALVFSQFTSHLALIRAALDDRGFTYEYLDGSTPAAARQTAVDRFQDGVADAFLISLKAGGTGLNLTAADYVIHMDPWWNPAVEDQATDRAHRYGQDKPVMVYRIVARGTIEEEILSLHDSKRNLVAGVMQGTQAAAKLTNDDLIKMMKG